MSVFLSHGDLDHFNGLTELLERFHVAQVTYTPTFPDKKTAGIRYTLEELERRGVPCRVVKAGDRLHSGAVEIEVLHPPPRGPDGVENARSMVLLVRHAGHTILLTGDLADAGLARVLTLPRPRLDVMQAPHHGSPTANTRELGAWARPRLVVACQGPPRSPVPPPDPYGEFGAIYLGTWPEGAVTVRSRPGSLLVETFASRKRLRLEGGI